jgi:hypothetical protein
MWSLLQQAPIRREGDHSCPLYGLSEPSVLKFVAKALKLSHLQNGSTSQTHFGLVVQVLNPAKAIWRDATPEGESKPGSFQEPAWEAAGIPHTGLGRQ